MQPFTARVAVERRAIRRRLADDNTPFTATRFGSHAEAKRTWKHGAADGALAEAIHVIPALRSTSA